MKGKKVFLFGVESILCKTKEAEERVLKELKELCELIKTLEAFGEVEVVDYHVDYTFNKTTIFHYIEKTRRVDESRFIRFDTVENFERCSYLEARKMLKKIVLMNELERTEKEETNV